MTDAEELRQARMQIQSLRTRLIDVERAARFDRLRFQAERDQARRFAGQIDAIRRTRSWKVTAPLRVVRRLHGGRD